MSTYEISKSSLVSLKAEILKKQEDINKAKFENKNKFPIDSKRHPLEVKNKGVESRASNDLEQEDIELLGKSKQILEEKAKLYDKLSQGSKTEEEYEEKKRYLVHFDKKANRNRVRDLSPEDDEENDYNRYPESDDEGGNEDDYTAQNSDEEWVEYVDCLGRTRTCLQKELHLYKEKDESLRKRNNSNSDSEDEREESEESNKEYGGANELWSSDMRRELQRREWEKEEDELRDKKNIHYQDILFNEARTHGVGYYEFSKDEEERAKQQEALNELRKETKDQQKRAQEIKKIREKQLAARIRVAENRKRTRLGILPLTSDDEEDKTSEESTEVTVLNDKAVQEDEEREAARKAHVRPWDIGKNGVKEHYEHTQEEWNELQRNIRDNEFAPPINYNYIKEKETSSHFSSKKHQSLPKRNNFKSYMLEVNPKIFESTVIVNELSDESDDDILLKNSKNTRKGAEVAPPTTFDYYGPSSSKKSRQPPKKINVEDSIMEGLKYLRERVERRHK